MATKLHKYLEQHEYQFGFTPKHSTIHPIIRLLNQIANENDKYTKQILTCLYL